MTANVRTPGDIRETMLAILKGYDNPHGGSIQYPVVIHETTNRITAKVGPFARQTVLREALDCWHDLMRTGFLAWGFDEANLNPPHAHLTAAGKQSLAQPSRDPANPLGYMAVLKGVLPESGISEAYVLEALETFNSACFKATAVLIGAASEALVIDLRDTLVEKLGTLGKNPPKDLTDWRSKRVLDALEGEFRSRTKAMPEGLLAPFDAFWSAFTGQLRLARNEAGHPKSIAPVTRDVVHGSLLIFPELAKLVAELRAWLGGATFV